MPDQPESKRGETLGLSRRDLESLEISLEDVARDVRIADGQKVVDTRIQRDCRDVLREERLLFVRIRRHRAEFSHLATVEVDLGRTGLSDMDPDSVAELLAGPNLASKPANSRPSTRHGFGITKRREDESPLCVIEVWLGPGGIVTRVIAPISCQNDRTLWTGSVENDDFRPAFGQLRAHRLSNKQDDGNRRELQYSTKGDHDNLQWKRISAASRTSTPSIAPEEVTLSGSQSCSATAYRLPRISCLPEREHAHHE